MEQKFHHRHFPTFTRVFHRAFWKLMHLYFPMAIHFMTDKYEGRLHHLVVDVIYVSITFVFLATNIGLGIWYVEHLTPADITVAVVAPEHMSNGSTAHMALVYTNPNRAVENVAVDVYMPHGFVAQDEQGVTQPVDQPLHFSLGNLAQNSQGFIPIHGVIFGDVGQTYSARVVTTYSSYSRTQSEVSVEQFTVTDTSFHVSIDMPKAATYHIPVTAIVHYENASAYPREDVEFFLDIPSNFELQQVSHNDQDLPYNTDHHSITLSSIADQEKGDIELHGVFVDSSDADVVSGDVQSDIAVRVSSHIPLVDAVYNDGVVYGNQEQPAAIHIVEPRMQTVVNTPSTVDFGDTIPVSIQVKNIGDVVLSDITLNLQANGAPLNSEDTISLPVIDTLEPNEEKTITQNITTHLTNDQQVSAQFSVSGKGHSQDIDADVDTTSETVQTRFRSQVSVAAELLYYGPNQEELGYGPYPPQAWETTSLRALIKLTNKNNVLSGMRVHAVLPKGIEWSGISSVSAGTTFSWDAASRTISWSIPTLASNTQNVGAQFEVLFTPNHLQVGAKPHIVDSIVLDGYDTFTQETVHAYGGSLVSPESVVPAPAEEDIIIVE